MRVYLSGPQGSWRPEMEGHHLLVSYAEPRQIKLLDAGWDVPGWLVDSGAFTAWTKGRPIDLDAYIAFLVGLEARAATGALVLDGYLALDVIPGEPGRLPAEDEARWATGQSLANLAKMRAAGLNPIPIFHEGEPLDLLAAYVTEGHDVIALGATASRGKPELVDWLQPIFDRYPGQRFHGLAMTQRRVIEGFPFDSVDSTTWLNFCRFGLKANKHLLEGHDSAFYRRLGIQAIENIPRCRETRKTPNLYALDDPAPQLNLFAEDVGA